MGKLTTTGHDGVHTVLVVNDTPDQLELLCHLLGQAGYRVFAARDGLEGFEAAKETRPDLVISDVLMPRMDGIEMCRRLRADQDLKNIPILLVSALRKDTESVLEGLQAGADDYLEAPYEPMHLVAKAARLLERAAVEEHYREIVEQATDIIGYITSINRAGARFFGRPSEELIGKHIGELLGVSEPERFVTIAVEELRQSMQWRQQIEVKDHSGSIRWLDMSRSLILDNRGEVVGVRGISRDITEQKQLEEQFRQSQKLESVGQLAGGIAHDFNNLLTVITGYSDLLQRRIEQENPLRRNVDEIRKAAERASSLTRQLLAFSRKQILQPVVLNLNDTVANMDKMLQRLIGEDIHLVTILDHKLDKVKTDPGQIEQVIMNLAVNARDAMPKGGKLTIETKNVYLDEAYARRHVTVKPGAHVMLAVSDTGTGMDAEIQARIFEPFFTTKEQGKGTGLGLSMVYGIVKQSGGNIWVYSEPGHGTTFKIYLPVVEEAGDRKELSLDAPGIARGTETILLGEDDEAGRVLLQDILETEGYTILEARNGSEALQMCERHKGEINLLMTDVVMPGMSGRQLVERLTEKYGDVKVLYMSGYTDNAIVHHGVLDPGVAFLQKPFTPEAVARKVREVLDAA
ncbi:MAG: response regulator [Acidobacteriota bacterium]|nr:response regulator [Acidobacteriota bacterium]